MVPEECNSVVGVTSSSYNLCSRSSWYARHHVPDRWAESVGNDSCEPFCFSLHPRSAVYTLNFCFPCWVREVN